jgi:putative heme-binding domain-containing protein
LADDAAPAVRLQLACSLGATRDERAGEALARILAAAGDDSYLRAAVFSSLRGDNLDASFRTAVRNAEHADGATRGAVDVVALAAALGRDDLCDELFGGLAASQQNFAAWQIDAADRWLRAAAARAKNATSNSSEENSLTQRVRGHIAPLLDWARGRASESSTPPELRAACLRLALRNRSSQEQAIELARWALGLQTPPMVQRRVAVQEFAALNLPAANDLLFGSWARFGPTVRQEVIAAALSRPALTEELVARIEASEISRAEIDAASRQRLLNSNSDAIRRRAKVLFGQQGSATRQSVIDEFKDMDTIESDSARGREVFVQKCAACHALDGGGYSVGPDLAALSDRSTPGLLAAILDPSRAVEPKYALYQAVTRDGRTYSGILALENAAQIELLEQENRRHTIPRDEIEDLSSSEKSLMPDGFEKELSRQQFADLIAYLQRTAGNTAASHTYGR